MFGTGFKRVCLLLLAAALVVGLAAAPASSGAGDSARIAKKKKCKKGFKLVKKNGKKKCRVKSSNPNQPAAPASALLSITPASFYYGFVVLGSNASNTFTITNGGGGASGPLVDAITGPNAARFSISNDLCLGISLGPGTSCTLVVKYSPTVQTADSASLNVSGSSSSTASAGLTGNGYN
jgi:hypothetical protein